MNCMKKRKKTTEREKILNRITFRKILISFSTTLHRGLRINICEITNYERYKLSNLKWDWIRAIRRSRRDWSLDPSQSALKKTLLSMQILWRKATLFWRKHSNIQTLAISSIATVFRNFLYNKFPQTISLQLLISNIVSCIQNLNKSRLIFYDKNFLLKGIITFILPQIFWSESMDARESVHSKRLKSGGWKGGCVSMT